MSSTTATKIPKARPSASADASRAAEQKRIHSLTIEDRIKESLSLGRRFRGLIPESSPADNGR
jgi:hypothetical protein